MNPHHRKIRYLVLLLVCMSLFSQGLISDMPAVLKEHIIATFQDQYGPGQTDFYFSMLYSCYSVPNIILPLISGFLNDIFGYRRMSVFLFLFIMLGSFVLFIGTVQKSFAIMIFGRFLYGLGGESFGITSSIIMMKWFVGDELSFSNSLSVSLVTIGTVLNARMTPSIAEKWGMSSAFGIGFSMTILSFIALLALNYIDQKHDHKETELTRIITIEQLKAEMREDIQTFPRIFWIFTILVAAFFCTAGLFISFSSSIVIELWLNGIDNKEQIAGDLMSIPYICCVLFTPLLGNIVDKKGKRIRLIIGACLLQCIGLVSVIIVYPQVAMILIGLAQSMFSATTTCVVYLIHQEHLGTAFGVMNSVQNMFYFIIPILAAIISAQGTSQLSLLLFFFIMSLIALLISVYLYQEDSKRLKFSLDSNDQEELMDYLISNEHQYDQISEEEVIKDDDYLKYVSIDK